MTNSGAVFCLICVAFNNIASPSQDFKGPFGLVKVNHEVYKEIKESNKVR
jgi:hypothetical protein